MREETLHKYVAFAFNMIILLGKKSNHIEFRWKGSQRCEHLHFSFSHQYIDYARKAFLIRHWPYTFSSPAAKWSGIIVTMRIT